LFAAELTLKPVPPFSFELSTQIFSNGDRQVRIYEDGKFKQIIRVDNKLALVILESAGTVDKPKLKAVLKSNSEISHSDKELASQKVNQLFNLELDLLPFYELAEKDETLRRITQRLRGLRSPTTQTVYEALMDSIIEQQISLKVATAIERRLTKKFGEGVTLDGQVYYAYPTAHALAQASTEELRASGLSGRKVEYIKEISALVAKEKLDLEKFRSYENTKDILEELDDVRGIGAWTAELTVIRSLQKWDAMPADDVGLRRIISQYYCEGRRITSEEAKRIAEPWGKWRGLAVFYFVIAELLKVEV
jgi:DNA-3-methyladenine glycosylase II